MYLKVLCNLKDTDRPTKGERENSFPFFLFQFIKGFFIIKIDFSFNYCGQFKKNPYQDINIKGDIFIISKKKIFFRSEKILLI